MDADLQDPPELLPQMLALMEQGADVVYAQRRSRPGDELLKRMACAVFYRVLSRLSETPIQLDTGTSGSFPAACSNSCCKCPNGIASCAAW